VTSSPSQVTKDTAIFGVRNAIVVVGFFGLTKIMSSMGESQAAAAGIIASMQGLMIGLGVGYLTTVGSEISAALGTLEGNNRTQEIASLIRIGFFKILCIAVLSFLFCWSVRLWLPFVLEDNATAEFVAQYMEGYSSAPLAEYFMIVAGQIIFALEQNPWVGFVNSGCYRLASIGAAYILAKQLGMGMYGAGLACSAVGLLCIAGSGLWFLLRNIYREMELFKLKLDCDRISKLWQIGWKFAAYRFTEWGNLFIIAQIIGAWSNENLLAFEPSMLALLLSGQLLEGFSLAGMLIANKNIKMLQKTIMTIKSRLDDTQDESGIEPLLGWTTKIQDPEEQLKQVKRHFLTLNVSGFIFNLVLVIIMFAARNQYIDFIMPSDTPLSVKQLAEGFLLLNLSATFPDALRVLSGSSLRAWNDLSFLILNSLINITLIGIPVGFCIGIFNNKDIEPLFIVRLVTLVVSAGLNIWRNMSHLQSCSQEIEAFKQNRRYGEFFQNKENITGRASPIEYDGEIDYVKP